MKFEFFVGLVSVYVVDDGYVIGVLDVSFVEK